MVLDDRSYNRENSFAVYAVIVRQSAKTFDINYDTLSFLFCYVSDYTLRKYLTTCFRL